MRRWLLFFLCGTLLLLTGCYSFGSGDSGNEQSYSPSSNRARGVWVSMVSNLDFPRSASSVGFRKNMSATLDALAAKRVNVVLFQVRSNCDAMYPSRWNPWSRWLAGKEGLYFRDLDPLGYTLAECHRRGMRFHAWMNPYRIAGATSLSKKAYLSTLHPSNFARQHPEYVLEVPLDAKGNRRMLFLNPGEPAVRQHIVVTVAEVAQRYPLDAVVFDDYFYPNASLGRRDADTARKYNKRGLSIEDWRRSNVTALIQEVHSCLQAISRQKGRRIEFGVSPVGIWANKKDVAGGTPTRGLQSYVSHYADTRAWFLRGDVDYLAPQVYWSFENTAAPYHLIVDWWAKLASRTKSKLYICQALYQAGSSGKGWKQSDQIARQIIFDKRYSVIQGEFFFSARHLLHPENPVQGKAVKQVFR